MRFKYERPCVEDLSFTIESQLLAASAPVWDEEDQETLERYWIEL